MLSLYEGLFFPVYYVPRALLLCFILLTHLHKGTMTHEYNKSEKSWGNVFPLNFLFQPPSTFVLC